MALPLPLSNVLKTKHLSFTLIAQNGKHLKSHVNLSKSFIIASKFIEFIYKMFVKIKKVLCKLTS